MGHKNRIGRHRKQHRVVSDADVGRPRKYRERKVTIFTYDQLSQMLWREDYKSLVKDALDRDPEQAAVLRKHVDSDSFHYKRVLTANVDKDKWALQQFEEKEDLRIAEQLGVLDTMASQKCRVPLKEARGIASKLRRQGMATTTAASYSGMPCGYL